MPASSKRYSIHAFSDMTGMPQSKIRYYEKLGLFAGRRQENGYRYYSAEDLFRANAFRSLLLYGFTVEQVIQMLDDKQNSDQFAQSLLEKQKELEHQRLLLDYRLHALQRSLNFIRSMPESDDFTVCDREDLLFVYSSDGWDFSIAGQNSAALIQITNLLGISRFTRVVRGEQLRSGLPIEPCYACSIPASERWRLDSCPPEQIHRLAMGKCLMFHRKLTREESIQPESFDPMKSWLREHGYRLRGDLVIHPTFLNLDGLGTDIETVIAPIE